MYKILLILRFELIVPSDLRHLSTYALIKYSSSKNLLSVKSLKPNVLMSTLGADNPLNGPLPPKRMFSENLRYNNKAVSQSLPRIISYLLLVDLSMRHFHITFLVAPNYVRHNFMFTFLEVVNFPAWVSHVVSVELFCLSFSISLPIIIFELFLPSNRTQKFLNNSLPLWVFIQRFSIGE